MTVRPGDGDRDRVRHLRARPPARQLDAAPRSQVVNAYAGRRRRQPPASRPRWDYDEETPLRDARGFDLTRAEADPSQLTDEDLGLANVILTNGARLYVDHAHPEYSSPEVTNPRDARACGTRPASGSWRAPPSWPRRLPGRAADQPLQEQHRQQGRVVRHPRELPDAPHDPVRRHRAPPHAVLRLAPGRHRRRTRRASGQDGRDARLPALPARRLLRGRGRARDHAQAPDHQHPRRAARRPGEVPPAARDRRRRQPRRDLHVPQARHHVARARDDRGRRPRPSTS